LKLFLYFCVQEEIQEHDCCSRHISGSGLCFIKQNLEALRTATLMLQKPRSAQSDEPLTLLWLQGLFFAVFIFLV